MAAMITREFLRGLAFSPSRTVLSRGREVAVNNRRSQPRFGAKDGEDRAGRKARVRCRISREALEDHFSDGDRLRPEAAFKKHRTEIEALARRKYILGEREPDGSVLIRNFSGVESRSRSDRERMASEGASTTMMRQIAPLHATGRLLHSATSSPDGGTSQRGQRLHRAL